MQGILEWEILAIGLVPILHYMHWLCLYNTLSFSYIFIIICVVHSLPTTFNELVLLDYYLEYDPNKISLSNDMIEEEIEEIEETHLADHIKESHTIEELNLIIDTLSEKYISKIVDILKENNNKEVSFYNFFDSYNPCSVAMV